MTELFATRHRTHSLLQNVAAVSAEFHAHERYYDFYTAFGHLDGFVGIYDLCIRMAKALSAWENENGGTQAYEEFGSTWIEVVEEFTGSMIDRSLRDEAIADAEALLRAVISAREG
jgi:hypothetical protein